MKSIVSRRCSPTDLLNDWGTMFGISITAMTFIVLFSATTAMAREKPLDLLFKTADADGNGRISEPEWHTLMQKRFESTDTNRDGNLTREELDDAKETLRERFRGMRSR